MSAGMRTAGILAIAAAALTACGDAQPAGQSADNIRVCQHYRTQRAYVKNLAEPTLADALKVEGWIAVDADQATPGTALKRDLNAMSAAQQDTSAPQSAVYNASVRVFNDCTALGVTFQPLLNGAALFAYEPNLNYGITPTTIVVSLESN